MPQVNEQMALRQQRTSWRCPLDPFSVRAIPLSRAGPINSMGSTFLYRLLLKARLEHDRTGANKLQLGKKAAVSLVTGVRKPGFNQGACLVSLPAGQSGMLRRPSCSFTAHPSAPASCSSLWISPPLATESVLTFFFLFLIEGQGRMGRECSSVNYINEDLVLFLIP